MVIDLPYPHKAIWPNGRAHHFERARQTALHRAWADAMTLTVPPSQREVAILSARPVPTHITVFPKARGPLPDANNVGQAAKAYFDGIQDRLGIDDKHFAAPTVEFSPERTSRFKIRIG